MQGTTKGTIWDGFSMPDKNFTRVPNDFVEILALIDNMAELKVVLYAMRHTWGFQEYNEHKKITTDEFMHGRKLKNRERMDSGTGLSEMSVRNGLAKAIEHGFLECEIDDSDRARVKKSYRLKMKEPCEQSLATTDKPVQTDKPKSNKERIAELKSMPYGEYLKTPEWTAKRAKALRFANFRCQLCNSGANLNVHHRTYERRGHELMGDLTVLCADCHSTFTYNRELAQ